MWPVKASRSMPMAWTSMGTAPAVCAASTRRRAPARWAIPAASAKGKSVPVTLLAWLTTTSRVPGVTCRSRAAGSRRASGPQGTTASRRPFFSSARSGRMAALCSIPVVTTRSPGRSSPPMARFMAYVAFCVKITRTGSETLKSSAMASRVSETIRPAAADSACPARPGLPPARSRKSTMARMTSGGLGHEVEALSR